MFNKHCLDMDISISNGRFALNLTFHFIILMF